MIWNTVALPIQRCEKGINATKGKPLQNTERKKTFWRPRCWFSRDGFVLKDPQCFFWRFQNVNFGVRNDFKTCWKTMEKHTSLDKSFQSIVKSMLNRVMLVEKTKIVLQTWTNIDFFRIGMPTVPTVRPTFFLFGGKFWQMPFQCSFCVICMSENSAKKKQSPWCLCFSSVVEFESRFAPENKLIWSEIVDFQVSSICFNNIMVIPIGTMHGIFTYNLWAILQHKMWFFHQWCTTNLLQSWWLTSPCWGSWKSLQGHQHHLWLLLNTYLGLWKNGGRPNGFKGKGWKNVNLPNTNLRSTRLVTDFI